MQRTPSREFMYKADGERRDAALHDPILQGASSVVSPVTKQIAINCGLTDDEIAALFGEPQ